MKVLVCGGREYKNQPHLDGVLNRLHAHYGFSLVIEGGARGADRLARNWADRNSVPFKTYEADWNTYAGNHAGRIRNNRMLREGKPDMVIGFKGGTGTAHMLKIAREGKVRVIDLRNL